MFERTSALFAHNSERKRSGRMGRSDREIACSVRNLLEVNMEVRNPDLEVWTRTKEPPLGTKGPCLRVPRPRPRLVRRLCARASCFSMPGGEGEIEALAAIAGLMLAALAVTRNGVRLPDILTTAMSSSLAADGLQAEDLEVDNLSFMLEAARESYENKQGKKLPQYIEGKVRRWVEGDVSAALVDKEEAKEGARGPLAAAEDVGAIEEKDREAAALNELKSLEEAADGVVFDKDTRRVVMRAMATQRLSGARLLQFAASLHMGRVVNPSDLIEMKLGCDPGMSKLLKAAVKAGRDTYVDNSHQEGRYVDRQPVLLWFGTGLRVERNVGGGSPDLGVLGADERHLCERQEAHVRVHAALLRAARRSGHPNASRPDDRHSSSRWRQCQRGQVGHVRDA